MPGTFPPTSSPDEEALARRLLHAAAETIHVDAVPSVQPTSHRRRAPWLLATAAAALAVAVILVVVPLARDAEDGPAAPSGPSAVTVPQTLLMTADQATAVLEDVGLHVEISRVPSRECWQPDDRVLGSRPPAATVVEVGSSVTVQVLAEEGPAPEGGADCSSGVPSRFPDVLALLDLARFGEGGLAFAPAVAVWVDGELTRTLTAEEADDPEAWGDPSPLDRFAAAVGDVRTVNGKPVKLAIWAAPDEGDQYSCGRRDPPEPLAGRPSTVVTVEDGLDLGVLLVCHWVRLYYDADGRVDAVASTDFPTPAGQAPDEPVEDGPGEPTSEQRSTAESFAEFAAGGPPPAFASGVELLLGSKPVATLTAEEAADPAAWSVDCETGDAVYGCPVDVLSAVAGEGRPAVTGTVVREPSSCHVLLGELPAELADAEALAAAVSLSVPEPRTCADNWELQLWLDADGAIRAVNLILGGS